MTCTPLSLLRLLAMVAVLLAGLALSTLPAAEAPAKNGKSGKGKAGGGPARWEETIKKFEAADASTPAPKGAVLLVGGSNARRWTDVGTYFQDRKVINRGFGGAQLTDVLHYADRIVIPYAPKVILLNAGGNDLAAGKSPEQIRDAARDFITKVHATLPDTRIFCIGLPPVRRSSSPEVLAVIQKMNTLLAELAKSEKNTEFIDLFPAFLDPEGKPRTDFFVEDGTHFSPKGYAAVRDLLKGKF
ncbi:GDSL-type esterase/lipase family protein [Prosthecobacter sp.]|uniref:GDSL-type esterase/lipase family protein n=1 Tax=Prosthecobacter sp. TaxID=1965333 RepID=UPI003784FA19